MNLGAVCAAGCRVAATKATRQTFASGRFGQSTISQMVGSSRANLQCLPAASRGSLISEKSVTVGHDESKKSCSLEQKSVCFQKLIDSGAWHALLLWRLTMKHKKGLE
jgi:hypothetical protein